MMLQAKASQSKKKDNPLAHMYAQIAKEVVAKTKGNFPHIKLENYSDEQFIELRAILDDFFKEANYSTTISALKAKLQTSIPVSDDITRLVKKFLPLTEIKTKISDYIPDAVIVILMHYQFNKKNLPKPNNTEVTAQYCIKVINAALEVETTLGNNDPALGQHAFMIAWQVPGLLTQLPETERKKVQEILDLLQNNLPAITEEMPSYLDEKGKTKFISNKIIHLLKINAQIREKIKIPGFLLNSNDPTLEKRKQACYQHIYKKPNLIEQDKEWTTLTELEQYLSLYIDTEETEEIISKISRHFHYINLQGYTSQEIIQSGLTRETFFKVVVYSTDIAQLKRILSASISLNADHIEIIKQILKKETLEENPENYIPDVILALLVFYDIQSTDPLPQSIDELAQLCIRVLNVACEIQKGLPAVAMQMAVEYPHVWDALKDKSDLPAMIDFMRTAVQALKSDSTQIPMPLLSVFAYQAYQYFTGFEWGILVLSSRMSIIKPFITKLALAEQLHQFIPHAKNHTALRDFLKPEQSAIVHLLSLVSRSAISPAQETKMVSFFECFPFVKTSTVRYLDALAYEQIASHLFKTIKKSENKQTLITEHLKLNDNQQILLRQIFSISDISSLPQMSIPDLMILLVHRYGAYDLLKMIDTEDEAASAQFCQKLLATTAEVEIYLGADFAYAVNYTQVFWHTVSESERTSVVHNTRKQAFALAYNDSDVLSHTPRNSLALAQAYHDAAGGSYHEFTSDDLHRFQSMHDIQDDSISTCTGTTVLATLEIKRVMAIKEAKELNYQKILIHTKKNKSTIDQQALDRLIQDIQSNLCILWAGVLSVASKMVERANTTYADTALDLGKMIVALLPEPISQLIGTGLLKAGKFLLDETQVQRFLEISKNLNTFENMDIINKELAGCILEQITDDFIRLLNSPPDKEKNYKLLSTYLIAALTSSILSQFNDQKINPDNTIHLGGILAQGFKATPFNLQNALESFKLIALQK
jgi:hypothetical protein